MRRGLPNWMTQRKCLYERKKKVVENCNGDRGASCLGESPHAAVFTNRPSLSLSPCIAGCCLHTASSVLLPPTQRSHLHLVMLFWLSVSWNSFLVCLFLFHFFPAVFLIFLSCFLCLLLILFFNYLYISLFFSNLFFYLFFPHSFLLLF